MLYDAVFKLEIIDVCLTSEDPQEVFESMNSTGRGLTNTDLIRNYLLMGLPHDIQERLYKTYWAKIEKNIGSQDMDIFMTNYLIVRQKTDEPYIRQKRVKISKSNLYDCCKAVFPPEKKTHETTEELLADIYQYSTIYSRIYTQHPNTLMEKSMYELVTELNVTPMSIFLMYLLHEQSALGVPDEEMNKAIQACISYAFRVRFFRAKITPQFCAQAIINFEKTDKEKQFVDRIWDTLVTGSGAARFPRDREFENAMETRDIYLEFKAPLIRYMLYKFERTRTREVVEDVDVTIEHILPQEARYWKDHLEEIGDDEYPELVHRIGNLTLTKMNSELSNDNFENKKGLYATSNFTMTRDLIKEKDWNSKRIKARSKKMAKEALKLWPLPERYNGDTGTTVWETINMDEDTARLFMRLRESTLELDPGIYEDTQKMYINYVKGGKNIFSLIPSKDKIQVTFNARIDKLPPYKELEDIEGTIHWGVGFSRMTVEDDDDILTVLECAAEIIG